ncbi:MAG: lysine--tRNA ligase [Candidatus Blackburnbacteria bacterium]|nr:lysine--tRNA ligase [Candidatus Blackburnbacteria bacterium]
MYWADKAAYEIIDSGSYKPYLVDDMFTPSGFPHVGSLRGPLVHDAIYRALKDARVDVRFTYVFNDFDPIDGLPVELQDKFSEYLGFPLREAPSPEEGFNSFAQYFTEDLKRVLGNLGVNAEFVSSYDMYKEGKFDGQIKTALDNAETIQDIYLEVSGSKKKEMGWLPLQVVCENCGKLGTTKVIKWDGEKVKYVCEPELVKWAKGCGHTGEVSPFGGNAKLPWKVDWPAHWQVLGVTIEGAGKDHSVPGSSRDVARALCEKVFHYPEPYNLPYEFFLLRGGKMSSSKGLGLKARELTSLLPPSVGRFLFTRTDYRQTVEFEPFGTLAIPDLFDEYDECWQEYIKGGNNNLIRAFEIAQVGKLPEKKETFFPRFRDVVNYVQMPDVDLDAKFEELKGASLTEEEKAILKEREEYARVWMGSYAPDELRLQMSKEMQGEAKTLTVEQKEFLQKAVQLVESTESPEDLQVALYNLTKEMNIGAKDAFAAIYLSFIGKTHGPRAAWFLLQYPKEQVIERLKEASK